uniref:RING-type E3 ubiquitin transferase n=1 Tax=Dromaius novaehollandiae TaxID=8790 RepID=A0A8C4JEI5_DRONO
FRSSLFLMHLSTFSDSTVCIFGGGEIRIALRMLSLFCHSCISTSLKNNAWTCPYCRAYLSSEGIPATDIAKKMKIIYQNCTECETQVCLSEMRAHLRTCEEYLKKYGPLQEPGDAVTRYSCPFCQCEVDEDDLMDHCLTYHRSERTAVYCPISVKNISINTLIGILIFNKISFFFQDINIVEEVLIETVLDRPFLEYVNVNHPNST